jgi:hypothetical protein
MAEKSKNLIRKENCPIFLAMNLKLEKCKNKVKSKIIIKLNGKGEAK